MFGQIPPTPYDLRFALFGIPVRVHPVFWLTSAFLAWPRGETGRLDLVFIRVLCIFVAILIHELGHAVVTRRFGWQPEIVLYFFGGYATSVRHSTWKDIAVSAAGPLAGLALYALLWFGGAWVIRSFGVQHPLFVDALNFSLFINLVWNVMNLVPVLPLDGGQISRELFCWLNPRKGMEHCLILSMLAGGGVALWALRARAVGEGVLGLDPLFLAIMFGFLSFQSYQALEACRRGYR